MKRCRNGAVAGGAALALVVSVAVAGGCGQFKAFLARRAVAPSSPEVSEAARPAIRPSGGNAAAHYRLGRYYAERRRHHEAASEFRKAVEADPASAKAWNGLGVCLDALGRFDDAASAYAEALRIDPSLDYVHNNLGYSQVLGGNREQGLAEIEKAIELNPANQVARRNLELVTSGGAEQPAPAATASTVPSPAVEIAPAAAVLMVSAAPAPAAPAAVALPGTAASAPAPVPAAAPNVAPGTPAVTVAAVPAAPAAAPGRAPEALRSAAARATPPAASAAPARTPDIVVQAAATAAVPSPAAAVIATARAGKRPAAAPDDGIMVPVAADAGRPGAVRLRKVSAGDLRKSSRVEVANESNQPKLHDEVAAYLAAQGYRVESGRPAARQKRGKTMIQYRDGALQPAYLVAQSIPGSQEMKKTNDFASPETTVRVLLGRDLEGRRKEFAAREFDLPTVAGR